MTVSLNKRYALTKQHRLLTKKDFNAVFSKSYRYSTPYWTVLISKQKQVNPRLGLVIGKKAAKKAVRRNLIKRTIRESFRLHQHDIKPNDVVFIAKPAILHLNRQTLREQLDQQWKRLQKSFVPV